MQRECPYCGSRIPKTARTCVICGHVLPTEAPPASVAPAAPIVPAPPEVVAPYVSSLFRGVGPTAEADDGLPDNFLGAVEPDIDEYVAALPDGEELLEEPPARIEAAVAGDLEQSAASIQPVETDLVGLVAAYAVIGGYSAALVGLFTPLILILIYSFTSDSFGEWLLFILLIVGLGAIAWIPVSVIVAIVTGVGGLLLGLGVGIVAAILFRLAARSPEAYRAGRVLVAILNAAVFGYAAYWAYSNSFLFAIFDEFTLLPAVFALIGGVSGLLMALVSPEKSEAGEPLSEEESAEALQLFSAPFRLWRHVARGTGSASVEFFDDALRSNYDPNHPEFQKKEWERLNKETERQFKEMEREQKKWMSK